MMSVAGERLRTVARALGRVGRAAEASDDTVPRRPRARLTWPLRGLLAASLAVPLLLFGMAAWQNFRLLRLQAEERVQIEAGQLHEHAFRAFETYALVLSWIDNRMRGLDWDRIAQDEELHRLLADVETLPQIGAVSVIDASGHVRATGRTFPAPAEDASGRDAFALQKPPLAGILVVRAYDDPLTHGASFEISRRRSTPDGSFDGVIALSARPDYFSDFFSTVSRNEEYSALLIHSDGTVLVRYPALAGPVEFSRDRPVMQAIAAQPDRGIFRSRGRTDGVERVFGYQQVVGYPVYVAFGIPWRGMLASWRANLVDYLLFALPASLALFAMTLFAARQLQRQKIASWRWQNTARRLRREMDRRVLAEAELRQSQKMEALGQLTGGVAHDFNNLLTVLQGCLELLSGRQRDARMQARVEMGLRTIERGEKLTGQLLAFARRQPLTVESLDLNSRLRRMTELLVQTVGSGIGIETDLAPDLWPLDADAGQLDLAVINLAINARDAMPEGGVLRIRTFNATLSGTEPGEPTEAGDFVGLAISDNGTGMPPEVAARAFEPFFTTKGPDKGTGLGLSMVYGFARQSGGTATIRSAVGRGTTVSLHLPRSRAHRQSSQSDATGLPPDGPA